jgi:hypothetical protein
MRHATALLLAAIAFAGPALLAGGEQYENRPCTVCKGTGKERAGDRRDTKLYPCRNCKGTGSVKVLVKKDPVKPGKTMPVR